MSWKGWDVSGSTDHCSISLSGCITSPPFPPLTCIFISCSLPYTFYFILGRRYHSYPQLHILEILKFILFILYITSRLVFNSKCTVSCYPLSEASICIEEAEYLYRIHFITKIYRACHCHHSRTPTRLSLYNNALPRSNWVWSKINKILKIGFMLDAWLW